MKPKYAHTFHIPVMGLAYTIDTPVKVARYGIASVMSIGEDRLIETMRNYYCKQLNREFIPIKHDDPDYRARRITAYLNLVDEMVTSQFNQLKNSPFEPGSEITKYFELLPNDSWQRQLYQNMLHCKSAIEQFNMQQTLRQIISPGSIDVNVMTKTDRNNYDKNGNLVEDGSDAVAALRGYANSTLHNSSIVFSAGLNPRLYGYLEKLKCFYPGSTGKLEKKIIIKVSDYRSALIQGKYLAKKGLWVSEFRIESGLNCGGHAFATDGYLLGPILEEFKQKRTELTDGLYELYKAALLAKNLPEPSQKPELMITVQGGIGTAAENEFLLTHYEIDSTGWGTPFLLVPEATTVDDETLKLLSRAQQEDVVLSHNSPLGVRYYYLKGTSAEKEKQQRINSNKPGSPCTEKHLAFNTEFTDQPICTASSKYQQLKINDLKLKITDPLLLLKQIELVTSKECLCIGLSNAAAAKYDAPFLKNLKAVTVCPGPNIINFDKVVSLKTMIDHIYGRDNILYTTNRPHMFIQELQLYINFIRETVESDPLKYSDPKKIIYYKQFFFNLQEGISFYRNLYYSGVVNHTQFQKDLSDKMVELTALQNYYLNNVTGTELKKSILHNSI